MCIPSGKPTWRTRNYGSGCSEIPDRELWQRHQALKQRLISYTRTCVYRSWEQRGEPPERLAAIADWLDPEVLTIGFARRFSPYKRGHLIIRDPERAKRLLTHPDRPVQLIFAGKAHPADEEGKRIIQRLMEWCHDPEVQQSGGVYRGLRHAHGALFGAGGGFVAE
jgi:starch phosphorylase